MTYPTPYPSQSPFPVLPADIQGSVLQVTEYSSLNRAALLGTDINMYKIKKGDRLPVLRATLTTLAATGRPGVTVPVDLTASTVKFLMRPQGSTTPKVNASATVDDAFGGGVSYAWGASDTDTAGTFEAEFEVTNGSGLKLTAPNDGYLTIVITGDVA